MSEDSQPGRVRSAFSELQLLGGLCAASVVILMVCLGNFALAALNAVMAVTALHGSHRLDQEQGVAPLIAWKRLRILLWPIQLFCLYVVSWFASYSVLMRGDYRWVETYFELGWTGGQGQPTVIQVCAAALTLVLALAMWLASRRRRQL